MEIAGYSKFLGLNFPLLTLELIAREIFFENFIYLIQSHSDLVFQRSLLVRVCPCVVMKSFSVIQLYKPKCHNTQLVPASWILLKLRNNDLRSKYVVQFCHWGVYKWSSSAVTLSQRLMILKLAGGVSIVSGPK